ncbi:MAG: carbohydrate kinase family protein [Mycobacterium leprae]
MYAVVMGDFVLDLVALTPGALHRGSDTVGQIYPRPGGSAANTATWLARLGQPVRFIGRVGSDPLGSVLVAGLRAEGVEPLVAVDPTEPTAVIMALVEPDGERSMLISPAAAHRLGPADVPESAFRRGSVLHLTAYSFFWESTRAAAHRAMALAKANGMALSVDASSTALLVEYGPDRLMAELAGVQHFFCNLEEGQRLTGYQTPAAVLDALAAQFPVVGLKLGAAGSLCAAHGKRVEQPAWPATPADSTGCGDSWDAGLLAGLLAGLDLAEAVAVAARTAAWVVARPGAVPQGWSETDRRAVWGEYGSDCT